MIERRHVVRWLRRNGFRELAATGGHRFFKNDKGHKIMIRGHGRSAFDPWTLGQFLTSMRKAGYDPKRVREELGS